METGDVLAIVAATVVAILCGVLIAVLYALAGTLRELRTTVHTLREETVALLDDAHDAVVGATREVDRIDRLVGSAERINGAVDGAQRMAYKTLASPVVKAMAFGTGVSRAAQRIRAGEGDTVAPAPGRSSKSRSDQTGVLTMFKRLFWLVVGFIAGLGSSWAIARRLRRLAARYAPPEVADRWGGTMRAAVDEGRAAMRLREAELKESLARGRAVA